MSCVLRYRITTPEQVSFRYEVAGLVSRCLAWLFDQMLIFAGYVAIVWAFAQMGPSVGGALMLLGIFILDFSYFTCFELYMRGQSPGKRVFRLRVISARGARLQFADILIRNLIRPIDMMPIAMVVGGMTSLIDERHRRLGDMVADTLVVRDTRTTMSGSIANAKARVNSFQSDAAFRGRVLNRVTRDERELILDLTLRRDHIEPAVRESLFAKAAEHFRRRLSLPDDLEHLSDEQTIVNLALLIQEAKFTA